MQQAYDLYLIDVLRLISDALLAPVIIILLCLIAYALVDPDVVDTAQDPFYFEF